LRINTFITLVSSTLSSLFHCLCYCQLFHAGVWQRSTQEVKPQDPLLVPLCWKNICNLASQTQKAEHFLYHLRSIYENLQFTRETETKAHWCTHKTR
jgi:hypothetical protein